MYSIKDIVYLAIKLLELMIYIDFSILSFMKREFIYLRMTFTYIFRNRSIKLPAKL